MIQSIDVAMRVVDTVKKSDDGERYRVRIDTFKQHVVAQESVLRTLNADVLLGLLSGFMFTQKIAMTHIDPNHPIQQGHIIMVTAVAELYLEALEPKIS